MNGLPVRVHATRKHLEAAAQALRVARGGVAVLMNLMILEEA